MSAGGNNDCAVCKRHVHNVPLSSPSAINLLFAARGHRLPQRNADTMQIRAHNWKIKNICSFSPRALESFAKIVTSDAGRGLLFFFFPAV